MKFWTGFGFGLGLGTGLGYWGTKIYRKWEKEDEQVSAEEREVLGMNQNDRDYLEEKLNEFRARKGGK